jgi:hypothetical protein
LRRRHVKTSQSALYQYEANFSKHGLTGLVPRWGGGRRRRITPADKALIENLHWNRNSYRIYQLLRRGAGLAGPPLSRSTVQWLLKEFSEQTVPNVRHRVTHRLRPPEESGHA